jgi:mannose-6-phosphate isomerase-like protein (cupin superfamily)
MALQTTNTHQQMSASLNVSPAVLSHDLVDHPLFSLPRLAQLARLLRQHSRPVMHRTAQNAVNTGAAWTDFRDGDDVGKSIEDITQSKTWVDMTDTDLDPEYRAFRDQLVGDVAKLVGRDFTKEGAWTTGHIFVASANSVTHCHIDSETNFLFIMKGTKKVTVSRSSKVTDREIEQFYWGDYNAVTHRSDFDADSETFHLKAGDCLHIPVNAPHWVENGPEPCIAYSLLLYLPENVERAHAFQFNHFLRRIGLKPHYVGPSSLRDRMKARALGAFAKRNPVTKQDVIHSARKTLAASLKNLTFQRSRPS